MLIILVTIYILGGSLFQVLKLNWGFPEMPLKGNEREIYVLDSH